MRFNLRKLLIFVFFLSGFIYLAIIFKYRLDIWFALQQLANIKFLIVFIFACIFLFAGHFLRSYKMNEIMKPVKNMNLKTNLRALFVGYLFDILLPFRVGQFIRAYVLGSAEKISVGFTFSIVVLERAVDAIILGLISLFLFNYSGVILGVNLQQYTAISFTLIGISLILFTTIELFYTQNKLLLKTTKYFTDLLRPSLRDKTRLSVWSIIYGLQKTLKREELSKYLLYSVVMWVCYISATYLIAAYVFSIKDVFTELVRAVSSYLGLAVPSGPSYFGAFRSITGEILNSLWISPDTNTYIVASWTLLAIPTSIVGVYALKKTSENFRQLNKSIETTEMHHKLLRNTDTSSEMTAFLESFFSMNTLSHILHNIELKGDVKLVKYFKGGSNASTILIHTNNKYKVRKITPIQHAPKLIAQQNWLHSHRSLTKIPTVKNIYTDNEYYSFDIEYYRDYVPFFDYIHNQDISKSTEILTKVISYMFENIYKQEKDKPNPSALSEYINKRFIDKIIQTEQLNAQFRSASKLPKLIINGRSYINCLDIIEKIQSNKKAMDDLSTYRETPVHGDLTIDNILASTNKDGEFIIIDPNDENEISSAVIDFAKMFQSLEFGYEFLCRNNEPVKLNDNVIKFENSTSASYEKLYVIAKKIAKQKLTKKEYKSLDFHIGMMYLRMLPYRVNINPDNLLKFYAIAVIAFNNFYKQYEKN